MGGPEPKPRWLLGLQSRASAGAPPRKPAACSGHMLCCQPIASWLCQLAPSLFFSPLPLPDCPTYQALKSLLWFFLLGVSTEYFILKFFSPSQPCLSYRIQYCLPAVVWVLWDKDPNPNQTLGQNQNQETLNQKRKKKRKKGQARGWRENSKMPNMPRFFISLFFAFVFPFFISILAT